MKKALSIVFLFLADVLCAQSGCIKGTIWDEQYDEPALFVVVSITDGQNVYATSTDVEGNYYFKWIPPGAYQLSFNYEGRTIKGDSPIVVQVDKITVAPVQKILPEVRPCMCYFAPAYQPPVNPIVTRTEILESVNKFQLLEQAEGMCSKLNESGSGELSMRGGTSNQLLFIDGVKSREMHSLPSASLKRITVYDSFIPANYGDVTGAVMVIEILGYFDLAGW